jgi:GTP cyclohydrolase II
LRLAVTARRACALGIKTEEAVTLRLNSRTQVGEILSFAASASVTRPLEASPARPAILAGIDLARLAGRLPAVLIAEANSAVPTALVQLKATAVSEFRDQLVESMTIAACSSFRSRASRPHSSWCFATLSPAAAPPLSSVSRIFRSLSSSAYTQPAKLAMCLALAAAIAETSSSSQFLGCAVVGASFFISKGRGLGLLNKIRAYSLQDSGLDTIDANMMLGFENDERDYLVAARMLELLGCRRVVLLTNNPVKVADLSRAGIAICGRIPIQAPVTTKNRRYLATMAKRAGHCLDDVRE